jgi:hypothetical protein
VSRSAPSQPVGKAGGCALMLLLFGSGVAAAVVVMRSGTTASQPAVAEPASPPSPSATTLAEELPNGRDAVLACHLRPAPRALQLVARQRAERALAALRTELAAAAAAPLASTTVLRRLSLARDIRQHELAINQLQQARGLTTVAGLELGTLASEPARLHLSEVASASDRSIGVLVPLDADDDALRAAEAALVAAQRLLAIDRSRLFNARSAAERARRVAAYDARFATERSHDWGLLDLAPGDERHVELDRAQSLLRAR